MPPLSYDQALAAVRLEVARYLDGDFTDDQKLRAELRICSDDLTAIALALERRLKIKLPQRDYDEVLTAADLARAFQLRSAA
jgi:hypothetical protein